MKKVIGCSLWGSNPRHYDGFEAVVKGHNAVWRDWELRIYHDGLSGNPILKKLKALDNDGWLKQIHTREIGKHNTARSMLWRMKPIWDSDVGVCICRDMDAVPVIMDRWVVEEFINSNHIVHGINDAKVHSIPLMGGMIGVKCKEFLRLIGDQSWSSFVSRVCDQGYGGDQNLLMSHVWPKFMGRTLIHKLKRHDEGASPDYPGVEMRGEPAPRPINLESQEVHGTYFREIMPHLGAAGYDIKNAIEFYSRNCDPRLNELFKKMKAE